MKTIDAETLRDWLAHGTPVTVLDVRTDADRAEWSIPGSMHVNAYHALKANDSRALADLDLPAHTPVVTVCGAGVVSMTAAEQLAARGLEVYSLQGGMKAWSLAWNSVDVPNGSAATIIQVRRTGKGCLSYLVVANGEATVIDASLPPEVFRDLAHAHHARITQVLETHIHADHLSRSRQLADLCGATLLLPANDRVAFAFTPVEDGDRLRIGATCLQAVRTPGHTWESTSYLLDDAALFTGDTLFLSSVGRPDLDASSLEGRRKAQALYRSLQALRLLPRHLLVLPAHTSAPAAFDTIAISALLGQVVAQTPLLHETEAQFVSSVLGRIGATPPNYLAIVELNEHGTLPGGDAADLEAGANRCAVA